MFVTKKALLFILASLPFHSHGQCVDDPSFTIGPLNSDLTLNVGCSWITARPAATGKRVDRVCTPDVSSRCVASCTDCTPLPPPPMSNSAVFTMTNAIDGNVIVMYDRNDVTGELSPPLTFPTRGIGGDPLLNGGPSYPLASQNSLIVADSCLLAVNAGSNTLTSFQIFDGTSINMEMVSIVGSGGDTPVSITSSMDNRFGANVVYAINAGGMGSISGYTISDECQLDPITDSIRSLNLLSGDQTPAFTSPAQVGFTPDGTQLYVVIKGIDLEFDNGGAIYQWDVDATSGLVSNLRILRTNDNSSGFDFDENGLLLVANILFGENTNGQGSSISVFDTTEGDLMKVDELPNSQVATAWVKSNNQGCILATSFATNAISSLSGFGSPLGFSVVPSAAQLESPNDLEFSPDGNYVYVLSTSADTQFGVEDGQPSVRVYGVDEDCGLEFLQDISDGLPNGSVSVFGAVGMTVFTIGE